MDWVSGCKVVEGEGFVGVDLEVEAWTSGEER